MHLSYLELQSLSHHELKFHTHDLHHSSVWNGTNYPSHSARGTILFQWFHNKLHMSFTGILKWGKSSSCSKGTLSVEFKLVEFISGRLEYPSNTCTAALFIGCIQKRRLHAWSYAMCNNIGWALFCVTSKQHVVCTRCWPHVCSTYVDSMSAFPQGSWWSVHVDFV